MHRLLPLVWALALFGCSEREPVTIDVAAASSLQDVMGDLVVAYKKRVGPDVDVRLTFAGSQVLRLQLEQGAPHDVFVSAHPDHVGALVDGDRAQPGVTVAVNNLVLAVPAPNPAQISTWKDLPRAERIVWGTDTVPAGVYARAFLAKAGAQQGEAWVQSVRSHILSEETNVRLVRSRLELGEADAAFIYRTDVTDALVAIPLDGGAVTRAPVTAAVVTAGPGDDARAADFVRFLTSGEAAATWTGHGFEVP